MEERFDRLEQMIGDLGQSLGARIDGVELGLTGLGNRIDGLEGRLGARLDALDLKVDSVEHRLREHVDGVEQRLIEHVDGVEQRLRGHIEDVDAKLEDKFDDLSVRVGVLHEDTKRDFRFSLEALQGFEEQMDKRFDGQARLFTAELAPIRDALRTTLGAGAAPAE